MRRRLAIVVGVVLAVAAPATAATILVDVGGQGDYTTIQEGVDASASGDTVLVSPGTYTGSLNREISFEGRQITVVSVAGRNSTVIDCQSAGRAFVFSDGESRDSRVEGFTVRNGYAEEGGAVWMATASTEFFGCAFENNSADYGGAFYAGHQSSPMIEECSFSNNSATSYGGAIYTFVSRPFVMYCDFTDNSAGVSGGAISCKTWTVARVSHSTFVGNYAHDGGCIYVGTLYEEYDDAEPSMISFSRFADNHAVRGGALFLQSFSWVGSSWNTFLRNSADQGGAIFCRTNADGEFTVQNCTIVYNSAETGGGICSSGSSSSSELLVTQSIIAFSTQGKSLHRLDYSPVTTDLSLAYGNEGGDAMFGTRVLYEDPLFCDVYSEDFNLCENSPCRSVNNDWGFLMGSFRQVCGECDSPVRETSWGAIKAMFR